jgi:hypothetical protein
MINNITGLTLQINSQTNQYKLLAGQTEVQTVSLLMWNKNNSLIAANRSAVQS